MKKYFITGQPESGDFSYSLHIEARDESEATEKFYDELILKGIYIHMKVTSVEVL